MPPSLTYYRPLRLELSDDLLPGSIITLMVAKWQYLNFYPSYIDSLAF